MNALLRPARRARASLALFSLALLASLPTAQAATLKVGPSQTFAKPCQAFAVAAPGDTIEIDAAGSYAGDVCALYASSLTIRGVNGRPVLDAAGQAAEGKAIWVVKGNDTVIENIEFKNAVVPDRNGAGIRQEGTHLTVRGSYFHHNETGILTGTNASSDILIERSVFAFNGAGDGQSHNVYIGTVRKLTFRYNHSHDARVGHLLKSRAYENRIEYNRLSNEAGGTTSYEVDLPNGGFNVLMGNIIHQAPEATNGTLVSVGAEGLSHPQQEFYLVNNTLVNDRSAGIFVTLYGTPTRALAANNIFAGVGTVFGSAQATSLNNYVKLQPEFVSRTLMDYRALPGAPFVNAGQNPGPDSRGQPLVALQEYRDEALFAARANDGALDIGALEWVSSTVQTDVTPPVVALTAPAVATTVRAGSVLTLSASASDNVGVARVDMVVNGSVVCSLKALPYSCNWTAPRIKRATYQISARATDLNNNSAQSQAVSVTAR